ncbi:hypothetical protein Tco_1256763 [Tanacetum coccineum]
MQDGLWDGVDHGKARRGLDNIAAYDPLAETNFVHLKTLQTQAQEFIHFGKQIQEKKRLLAKDKEVCHTYTFVRRTFM